MGRFFAWAALIIASILNLPGLAATADPATQPAAKVAPPAPVPSWHPDRFPITYWYGPPPNFITPERYKQIADAGFTLAFPRDANTSEVNHKILDCSQAAGMKAFIADTRIPVDGSTDAAKKAIDQVIADFSSHPALAGYFICDEPGAGSFPGLAAVVKEFREKDPKHPAFINMLPNYVAPWVFGSAPSYDTFIENFVQIVHPEILSYDHYHFHSHFDASGFFANLTTVRRISMQAKIPFWNIVLLINHFDYRSPTEAELKWEAMQSLAFGAKGLVYFTYWQPGKEWGEAVINLDGTVTPKYEKITRVNHDILAIGKYLLNAANLRSYEFGQGGDETNTADLPIRFEGPNITVGLFKDGQTNYAMFANRDYKDAVTKDVFLNTVGKPLQKLDKRTDQWNDVQTNSAGETKVTLQIEAGDADLYRW